MAPHDLAAGEDGNGLEMSRVGAGSPSAADRIGGSKSTWENNFQVGGGQGSGV